jgi:hypothetical protein
MRQAVPHPPGGDRQLINHDSCVFYEDGIGQIWFGGEGDDFDSKAPETVFIVLMLLNRLLDVDGFSLYERERAVAKRRADGTGDGT